MGPGSVSACHSEAARWLSRLQHEALYRDGALTYYTVGMKEAGGRALFRWLADLAELLKPYSELFKMLQTALLLLTAVATVLATRRIKVVTKEVTGLVGTVDTLRIQADETVRQLNENIDKAILKLQGAIAEDRSDDSEQTDAAPETTGSAATDERVAHRHWWQPIVDTKLPGADAGLAKLFWKNNVRVPLLWPGTWVTVWRNERPDGVCGVSVSGKVEAMDDLWQHLKRSTADLNAALPPGTTIKPGRFGISITRPNSEFKNDDDRRAWMQRNLLQFLGALGSFRH
jgi:hypothetical protein